MAKYLCIVMAAAIVLAASMVGHATDLSMTPIYQSRPAVVPATGWALADRWTISSGLDAIADAPLPEKPDGSAGHGNAWSTGAGYALLARWGLKGEYVYVNILDADPSDRPGGGATAHS
jgi:hypothetical protein